MQTDYLDRTGGSPTMSQNADELALNAFAEPVEPRNEDRDTPLRESEPFDPISDATDRRTLDDGGALLTPTSDGEPVAAAIAIPRPQDDAPTNARDGSIDDASESFKLGPDSVRHPASDQPEPETFSMAAPHERSIISGGPGIGKTTSDESHQRLAESPPVKTAPSTSATKPIDEATLVDKPHAPAQINDIKNLGQSDKLPGIKKPRTFTLPSDARPSGPDHAHMISIVEDVNKKMFDKKVYQYTTYSSRTPKPNEQFVGSPRGTDEDRRIVMYSPVKEGLDRYVHLSKNMTQQLQEKFADVVDKAYENPKSRLSVGVGFGGDVTAQYVPPRPHRNENLLRKLGRLPPINSSDSSINRTNGRSMLTSKALPTHSHTTPSTSSVSLPNTELVTLASTPQQNGPQETEPQQAPPAVAPSAKLGPFSRLKNKLANVLGTKL